MGLQHLAGNSAADEGFFIIYVVAVGFSQFIQRTFTIIYEKLYNFIIQYFCILSVFIELIQAQSKNPFHQIAHEFLI